MLELLKKFENKQPEIVFEWKDAENQAEGWVVINSLRGGAAGGGMTQKGVNEYKSKNPGSKLQTAVTTKPSKLKPGSKAANRRKSFCARSRSWTGERGRAARRRWNC